MSVFRESLVFFDQIGLYDVVLPFLLVFTLVYGILEKSKIFGTEKSVTDGKLYTRKNLNAMVAFTTGFFVVASAQLVELINVFVSRVALILVMLVMFMILIATFYKQQDENGLDLQKWVPALLAVVIPALVLIFLDGVGWLQPAWEYATGHWDSSFMGTLILFVIVVGFMFYVTKAPSSGEKKSGS
jgi:hypothetical protein